MNHGMSIKNGTLCITLPDKTEIKRVEVNGKTYTLPSRDVIDRQEAIEKMAKAIWLYPNELCKTLCCYHNARDLAEYGLKDVPSAEPETIRCKDCKWWGRKDIYKDGSTATVCKIGRSTSEEGHCHHAERKKTMNEVRAEYGLPPV